MSRLPTSKAHFPSSTWLLFEDLLVTHVVGCHARPYLPRQPDQQFRWCWVCQEGASHHSCCKAASSHFALQSRRRGELEGHDPSELSAVA